jgi:ABC-type cobalamin/Fe3+-siderophores transport system ATPase subunit
VAIARILAQEPDVILADEPIASLDMRNGELVMKIGAWVGSFVKADDAKYQVIRELNETAKKLAAQKH